MDKATLRTLISAKGIKQWQLAEALGIREDVLSKKLRHDLDAEDERKVFIAINSIASEKEKSSAARKAGS